MVSDVWQYDNTGQQMVSNTLTSIILAGGGRIVIYRLIPTSEWSGILAQ
jgi:hypothetical protein